MSSFFYNYRELCYKICWQIQGVITPSLRFSQYLYEDILRSHVSSDVKWLDLGCGHQLFPSWRSAEEKNLIRKCNMIVGIDYDLSSLKNHKNILHKIKGDITKLPFRKDSFHLLTSNMVIEHVGDPNVLFQEARRILKPGGIFILHTPNAFGYTTMVARCIPRVLRNKLIYFFQGRKDEDVFATYYKLNTRCKIISLAEAKGWEILKIKMIVSSPQLVIIPPLALIELIWIRILMTRALKNLRTNIIVILKKN